MRPRQRGITMIETMIAITTAIVLVAAGAALSVKLRAEARASTAVNAAVEIQTGMRELFGTASLGYPAGLAVAQHLRQHRRGPALPVNAGGCYEVDSSIQLCPSVSDDGGGRGLGWRLNYAQSVGGGRAVVCKKVVDAIRPQLLDISVGGLKPRDTVTGEWLNGEAWDGFWDPKCAAPITFEAILR